jgi:uncharacterized damage-inducible protein DinB
MVRGKNGLRKRSTDFRNPRFRFPGVARLYILLWFQQGGTMTSREFYLQRLNTEYPVTLEVLRALPQDRVNYKPDDRSPSAQQLAWTLTWELKACSDVVTQFKTNWVTLPPPAMPEMLKQFEENAKNLANHVSAMSDEAWEREAEFYYEGQLVAKHPAGKFAWLSLFDGVHHRGQLSAYLRPMGGKVPAIYGPSADAQGYGAWK